MSETSPDRTSEVSRPRRRHARTTLHAAALKPNGRRNDRPPRRPLLSSRPRGSTATARTHPVWFDTRDRRAVRWGARDRRCDARRRPGVARVRPDVHRVSVAGRYDAPPRRGSVGGREPLPRRHRAAGRVERPRRGGAVHGRGHDEERASVAASGGIVASARTAPACASRSSVTASAGVGRRFLRRGVDAPPSLGHPGR